MRDARSRRNRAGKTGQPPRKVESVTERSLRRTAAVRALAAEGCPEMGPRRGARPVPAYQRAVRSGSLAAAGMFAAMFALGTSASEPMVMAGAAVAVSAPVVTQPAQQPMSGPKPFGAHLPVLASVRTDDAFTVSHVGIPRRFAQAQTHAERRAERPDLPSPAVEGVNVSASVIVAAPQVEPLIAIIPQVEESSGSAVIRSLKPRYRPASMDAAPARPEPSPIRCGFGSIVQRGSTVFHRPPTCI